MYSMPLKCWNAGLFLLLAASGSLCGAVIRGGVVENMTGYSLSRALVTVQPVGAPSEAAMSVRTTDSGGFEFSHLPGGAYLVRASRRGFLPMEWGQRQWNSAGVPIVLGNDEAATLTMRLARFGAITGTVRDENEVGIPDQDVAAYTNTEPPRFVTRGRSDDRGVFRISGLDPGSYLVRTTGNEDLELSYLPTFGRQTLRVAEARPVQVYLDDEARDADVHPVKGNLFTISGQAAPIPDPQNFMITVTLASDLGRRTIEGYAFRFTGLAPGSYEIYVEAKENPPGTRFLGGYTEFRVDRNINNLGVLVSQVRETAVNFQGVPAAGAKIRRKDLAGVGSTQDLVLNVNNRALIPPGRWEIAVTPPSGYYVSRFSPSGRNGNTRPDGWNEILVQRLDAITVALTGGASSMHGVVKSSGSPAAAAPVFLEAWDPIERKRLVDLHETRADMRGNYRFEGLAPGSYRVLSTFEYLEPDSNAMDLAGAQPIEIGGHTDLQTDLELFGVR
jgi:Carboxypeptidase regulatory-like domain